MRQACVDKISSKFQGMDFNIRQSTCIKSVDKLQQTCYHQIGASDVNAS